MLSSTDNDHRGYTTYVLYALRTSRFLHIARTRPQAVRAFSGCPRPPGHVDLYATITPRKSPQATYKSSETRHPTVPFCFRARGLGISRAYRPPPYLKCSQKAPTLHPHLHGSARPCTHTHTHTHTLRWSSLTLSRYVSRTLILLGTSTPAQKLCQSIVTSLSFGTPVPGHHPAPAPALEWFSLLHLTLPPPPKKNIKRSVTTHETTHIRSRMHTDGFFPNTPPTRWSTMLCIHLCSMRAKVQ